MIMSKKTKHTKSKSKSRTHLNVSMSTSIQSPCDAIQRDPVVVYWPNDCLEAWGTKANKPHVLRKYWFVGLAAFGGKAEKPVFSKNKFGFLALVPQASKKSLGQ